MNAPTPIPTHDPNFTFLFFSKKGHFHLRMLMMTLMFLSRVLVRLSWWATAAATSATAGATAAAAMGVMAMLVAAAAVAAGMNPTLKATRTNTKGYSTRKKRICSRESRFRSPTFAARFHLLFSFVHRVVRCSFIIQTFHFKYWQKVFTNRQTSPITKLQTHSRHSGMMFNSFRIYGLI